MKNKKEVPMSYVLSGLSHDVSLIFELLYRLYGTFAFVLIYKMLKNRPKI